jgi:predicted Zn-dependent protease
MYHVQADTLDELDRKKKNLCPACREQLEARRAGYIEEC